MSGYLRLSDGRVVPVQHGIVIGRVAGCEIVVDDSKASRRHARLVVAGGVVEIEDLDSSNGTLLNGKPVSRRVLRGGDVVQIGKTQLVYHEGSAPGAAPPAAAAVLDDGDELFGEVAPAAVAPAAPVPVRAAAPPPPASPAPPPRPAPPAPPRDVVEFVDEVVEVRRAAEPPRAAAAPRGEPEVRAASRILQYHKTEGDGGLLGDDLAQWSGGTRLLVYAGVLLVAAAIVYTLIRLLR